MIFYFLLVFYEYVYVICSIIYKIEILIIKFTFSEHILSI